MGSKHRGLLLLLMLSVLIALAACNVDVTIDSPESGDLTPTPEADVAAEASPTPEPTPTTAPIPTPAPDPAPEPERTPTPDMVVGEEPTDDPTLYPIRVGDQWGFINRDGEVIIDPAWDRTWPFSDGFARIVVADDDFTLSFGLIDSDASGQIFDGITYLDDLSEGLAAFAVGGEIQGVPYLPFGATWGYMDVEGNIVIEAQFESAGPFVDGLAPVQINNEPGYIDTSGELVIEPGMLQHSESAHHFADSRAMVWSDQLAGFIDETGTLVIDHQFYRAFDFSEGLAAVGMDVGQMGYIDRDGNVAIEPRFVSAGPFSDGLAPVSVDTEQGTKYGYIDHDGEVVIDFKFAHAEPFKNGLAAVVVREDDEPLPAMGAHPMDVFDWGYIDQSGEFVWRQEDLRSEPFQTVFPDEKPLGEYTSVIPIVPGSEEKSAEEIAQDGHYLNYQPEFDLFMLVINEGPISETQVAGEEAALASIGGDMELLCGLQFQVTFTPEATDRGGYSLWEGDGLWICSGER